jgi:hypothetical protein
LKPKRRQDPLGSAGTPSYHNIGAVPLAGDRGNLMIGSGTNLKRFRRPLIAVIAAYVLAAEALLLAFTGFNLAASAADISPAFELCHHDATDAPSLPGGTPDQSGCNHCIFCFAGAHHVLTAPSISLFQRVNVDVAIVLWTPENGGAIRLPAHSIANPRGPPLRA